MGIFYNPPQPPTANAAGTTPEPHVPVGTQGSDPPRYSTALMFVAVLASWPADLEPRPVTHNLSQRKIAPLTLTYGAQPSAVGTTQSTRQIVFSSWPTDLEPRLSSPNNLQQKIAPLTLAYGDSPPVRGISAIAQQTIVNNWSLDLEPRLQRPNDLQQKIVPLTLVYGSDPPRYSIAARVAAMSNIWTDILVSQKQVQSAAITPALVTYVPYSTLPKSIWDSWTPSQIQPPTLVDIAPLTLIYGAEPPRIFLAARLAGVSSSWQDASLFSRNISQIAAITRVDTFVPFTRIPKEIWSSWTDSNIKIPAQANIAPLTLVYGSDPPRISNSGFLTSVVSSWQDNTFLSQGTIKSAAFRQADFVPSLSLQKVIWAAWADTPYLTPTFVDIAPLTLTYGQQPPIIGNSQVNRSNIVNSWPTDLEPRLGLPNNRQSSIAPLTLVYGSQPPVNRSRVVDTTITSSWPLDLEPRLIIPNNRQQSIAPLTLIYGQQPPFRSPLLLQDTIKVTASWTITWDTQSAKPNASWNSPPILALIPYRPLSRVIIDSWEPPFVRPPVPVSIAPLTLIYGQQPPIRSDKSAFTILSAWEQAQIIRALQQTAGWNTAQQVPYRTLPLSIRAAWDEIFLNLPTLTRGIPSPFIYVPLTPPPYQIFRSWQVEQIDFPRRVNIAPLTLRYGNEPPRRFSLIAPLASIILQAWPLDLEPRLGIPNNRQQTIAPLSLIYGDRPTPKLFADYTKIVEACTLTWGAQSVFRNLGGHLSPSVNDLFTNSAIIATQSITRVSRSLSINPLGYVEIITRITRTISVAGIDYTEEIEIVEPERTLDFEG